MKKSFLVFSILVASIFLVSCNKENSTTKVTIAQAGDFFLYAPLYIAKDAKIFEKNLVDVNIISTGGDEKTWAAVISGSAQFGIADPTFIAVSKEKGKPGKVVASIVNGVPFWGITYNKNIDTITSPTGLKGYSVATFPEPSTAYTLQKQMFIEGGLEPNIRQGAFGTILAMLKSDVADIGLELEPNVSQAVNDGARVVYSLADVYSDFAITGMTADPKYIEENTEIVQRVVDSIQEALDYIRINQQRSLEILINRFPDINRSVAKLALERVLKSDILPSSTVISPKAWKSAIQLRKEMGDVSKVETYETYIDTIFAHQSILHLKK